MEAIKRVWRGEAGLAWTFWAWGVAVNVLLNGVTLIAVALAMEIPAFQVVVLGLWLFRLAYQVFISVGVWRAANRFAGFKGWAFLAKFVVVLGVVQTLVSLFGLA